MTSATQYQHIGVRPLSEFIGAEVEGIDLSSQLNDECFAELRQAFLEHGVIFFRDQELDPDQQVAFAERWGPINVNRFFNPVPGYPKVAQVLKEPKHERNIGGGWHTDHSYDEIPALGSALYAKELPSQGGDTMFASLGAAFDALSDSFKDMLRGLRAHHSSRHVFGHGRHKGAGKSENEGRIGNPDAATQDATHPVIIRHPDSGREILYVNPGFTIGIEGWSEAESNALLSFLYEHAKQEQFIYRFNWEVGSLALWDNRATWHCALNDYPGERRYMHRVTIEGTALN